MLRPLAHSGSSKINTAGEEEGVRNSLKLWGAGSLVLSVDLHFHLFVLRGSICVAGWRKFSDGGGKLGAASQPRVCLRVLLACD